MKKRYAILICSILALIVLCSTMFAFAADENPMIKKGQIHDDDFITGGSTVTNDGVILGDFLAGAQSFVNNGEVEGDILAGAYDVKIGGHVKGSVRVGASDIKLSAVVDRNVMLFGSNVTLHEDSVVKLNTYLFGAMVNATGTVLGKTNIYAGNVTLGGNYEGDVKINGMTEGTSFKLLPGTVIKGKLIYEGVTEYKLPSDVQVGEYEYIKIAPTSPQQAKPSFSIWDFVKKIFTLLVYYLFALLVYKLFPRFFAHSGDFIAAKPLTAAGMGIATLGSLVAGSLCLILLLILVIFILKGSVFVFGGLVFLFVTVITILFADIPVSLWLGSRISNTMSVQGRLAIGLGTITIVKMILDILKGIQGISTIVGVVSFVLNISIWIFGTGALVKTIFEIGKSANLQAKAEEEIIVYNDTMI